MQRQKLIIPGLLIILLLGVFVLPGFPVSLPKAQGLDVDAVVSDPLAYKGAITIRGAVMSVEPEKNLFQVIDYREYGQCGVITCAAKWITVSFNGKLPAAKDVVEVKGEMEKNEAGKGGFIFKASEVKVK
ncbi:MAG: hypothetical protein FJ134_06935 [Deltaproteobacteria bacterium]|nr:hypothetical protein [Deltaproteobacteria bacterium]